MKSSLFHRFVPTQLISLLRMCSKKTRKLLLVSPVIGILIAAIEFIFAYLIQLFIHKLGISSRSTMGLPLWVPDLSLDFVLVALFLAVLIRSITQWTNFYFQERVMEEFKLGVRETILHSCFFVPNVSSSDVSNHFTEHSNQLGNAVRFIFISISQASAALVLMVLLFTRSATLSGVALTLLCLIGLAHRRLGKGIKSTGQGLKLHWDHVYDRLIRTLKNLTLVHLYALEKEELQKSLHDLTQYHSHANSFHRTEALLYVSPQVFGMLIICIISSISQRYAYIEGGILLGFFYLFVRLVQNLSPVTHALTNLAYYGLHAPSFQTFLERLETSRMKGSHSSQSSNATKKKIDTSIGWQITNLNFAYDALDESTAPDLFNNFNFRLDPGKCLALIGPSGAGKSTFIQLLLAQLTPKKGEIKILFTNEETLPLHEVKNELLRTVGYVGPECFLFDGTLIDNLRYGMIGESSNSEVLDALALAGCDFIHHESDLNRKISDQGNGFSQGQKQRISLARALLRKPKLLVLDEATSNLDSNTESKLIDTLTTLKGQMTILIVSHRQAPLSLGDQLLSFPLGPSPLSQGP